MAYKVAELVDMANSNVPIETVLKDLFNIDVPPDAGDWKAPCPLGSEHSDGGRSKAMRVYSDTNSAWCFSHSKTFTPFSLWQLAHNTRAKKVPALEMLEKYGISTSPPSTEERWNRLDAAAEGGPVDVEHLKDIYISFLRTLPGYGTLQYEDEVLDIVSKTLRTLDNLPSGAAYDTLGEWLETAKKLMREYWRKHERL